MAFQVITRKRGEVAPTIAFTAATLTSAFDAAILVALNNVDNVFVALRDDTGTTLVSRYLLVRDVPSPVP